MICQRRYHFRLSMCSVVIIACHVGIIEVDVGIIALHIGNFLFSTFIKNSSQILSLNKHILYSNNFVYLIHDNFNE